MMVSSVEQRTGPPLSQSVLLEGLMALKYLFLTWFVVLLSLVANLHRIIKTQPCDGVVHPLFYSWLELG